MPMFNHIVFIAIGVILTYLSMGVAMIIDPTVTSSVLEMAAVAVSFSCTILFALQKRVAYHYGVVSTALLCGLFVTQGVYALAIFNGLLTLSLLYGYVRWGKDESSIPVTLTNLKGYAGYLAFFAVVYVVGKMILGVAVSPTDLALAAGSATAQLMLGNKKWENWIVWIVINIFSIVFFWQQGLALMAVQFVFFTINAIIALIRWRKDIQKEVSNVVTNN